VRFRVHVRVRVGWKIEGQSASICVHRRLNVAAWKMAAQTVCLAAPLRESRIADRPSGISGTFDLRLLTFDFRPLTFDLIAHQATNSSIPQ
jgi:hypothetical protein